MPFKLKFDGAVGFPIYDFLSVFNGSTWPNGTSLRDKRFQSLRGLEFGFRCHINDSLGLIIYKFLLLLNSNVWPN